MINALPMTSDDGRSERLARRSLRSLEVKEVDPALRKLAVSSSQRVLPGVHFSLGHGAKPASKQNPSVQLPALPADGLISRAFPLSGTQHGGGLVARAAATAHHEGDGFFGPGARGG